MSKLQSNKCISDFVAHQPYLLHLSRDRRQAVHFVAHSHRADAPVWLIAVASHMALPLHLDRLEHRLLHRLVVPAKPSLVQRAAVALLLQAKQVEHPAWQHR